MSLENVTEHSLGWKIWLILKTLQARLRFIVILAVIGGVIGYWDTLKAYYERWARPAAARQDIHSDTEYFCPMHPSIIRDKPNEKCPICFMPLSKRKKGEKSEEALPAGVVSRVQLSPYRIALAGVRTLEVGYQRLSKEITTVGFVEFDERKRRRISSRLTGRSRIDKLFVNVTGQSVRKGDPLAVLYNQDLVVTVQLLLNAHRNGNQETQLLQREKLQLLGIDGPQIDDMVRTGKPITQVTIQSPISGHVTRKYQTEGEYVEEGARLYDVDDLSTVWIQPQVYEDEVAFLQEGLPASATTAASPDREFKGKLSFINPHLDQNSRTLTVRFDMDNSDHELWPGSYATIKLRVPPTRLKMFAAALNEKWRNRTTLDGLAFSMFATHGFVPAFGMETLLETGLGYSLLNQGLILAVPDNAVIDTGSRKVVYRQSAAGVFDGVQVRLGPRMVDPEGATVYPVLRGLEPGDRVVTNGSFLIDAETRLNPAAGSIYYGGGGAKDGSSRPSTIRDTSPAGEDPEVRAALAGLKPQDRKLAQAQKFCVVRENNLLGSMGTPAKIMIKGESIFLCCEGCERRALANPEQMLVRAKKLRVGNREQGTGSRE